MNHISPFATWQIIQGTTIPKEVQFLYLILRQKDGKLFVQKKTITREIPNGIDLNDFYPIIKKH